MTESVLKQASGTLRVATRGKGLVDITRDTEMWLAGQRIAEGLLTLFCRHTSASLLIQENAAPAVRRDLAAFLDDLVPEARRWEHDDEGPDDMPAHVRTALTGTSVQVPVLDGRLRLGTWQAIYLFEHRTRPHTREIAQHVIGG